MGRMRVALYTDTFYPQINGVARTVERTAHMLIARGHTVVVCAPSQHPAATRAHAQGAYDVVIIPSLPTGVYKGERVAFPTGGSVRALRAAPPDLVHAHTPFGAGREALRAARHFGVPLVGTHHTFFDHYLQHVHLDFAWVRRATWRLTARYYNHCQLVLSPTKALADGMRAYGLRRPVEILANPTDTGHFAPATATQTAQAKRALNVPGNAWLYLGRLSYEKSVDQTMRAFAQAARQDPTLCFVLAGDGPERARLESLARELGVAGQTRFLGFVGGAKLLEAMHATDLYVSASKSENMPLAVLEVLAVGLPMVAVGSLGMSELVEDGVNGFTAPPDNPTALAALAQKVLVDQGIRERFGAAARERAARFDPSRVGDELMRAYERSRAA